MDYMLTEFSHDIYQVTRSNRIGVFAPNTNLVSVFHATSMFRLFLLLAFSSRIHDDLIFCIHSIDGEPRKTKVPSKYTLTPPPAPVVLLRQMCVFFTLATISDLVLVGFIHIRVHCGCRLYKKTSQQSYDSCYAIHESAQGSRI